MDKILIVEDDRSIAELERDYLQINGYECDIAESGDKGLLMLKSSDYDLAVLDVMLPNTDGFELLCELRKERDIPVIMLSARQDDIDKVRGLGLGADDYMTKPFSPNELVARVRAHISRYRQLSSKTENNANGSVIKIRGLTINPDAHRVFLDNEEINLTTKEFELLMFLASNPNRVFNKEVLFDRIWGFGSFGDLSTVTVHVQRLRTKIETEKEEYIETVWGVGYRFKA